MKLIIDGRAYDLDVDELPNDDAIAIEDETGLMLGDLVRGVRGLSMRALTALVWAQRRHDEPGLKFADVRFRMRDIEFDTGGDDEDSEDPKGEPEAES